MADNITAPATGAVLATDDIGSVHYPRTKIALGADGTAVDAVAGAGAVGAGVQRVTLASDDPAVAALAAATPAGSNIIGKVGIDQTTDGTTNKVNIDASLKSGTPARSTVASSTSSATILASNASRKGAIIHNTDANALLLDLSGGTAAATRCQIRLTQHQSHEVGFGYTGLITGIWEADGSGQADVVEFT